MKNIFVGCVVTCVCVNETFLVCKLSSWAVFGLEFKNLCLLLISFLVKLVILFWTSFKFKINWISISHKYFWTICYSFLTKMNSRQRHVTCIVPCCKIQSQHSNLKFFKFPNEETRRLDWFKSIGLAASDIKNKQIFICENHFRKQYINCIIQHSYRKKMSAIHILKMSFHFSYWCCWGKIASGLSQIKEIKKNDI